MLRQLGPILRVSLAIIALLLVLCPPSAGRLHSQSAAGARIAFLHLSADAPALDIYIDGGRAVTNLGFAETSAYLGVTAGTHQIQVTAASRLDALTSASLTAQPGGSYTWVISGVLSPADTNPPASGDLLLSHIVQLSDNAGVLDDTRLRIVHASPGAGPLDVRLTGPASVTAAANLSYSAVGGYVSLQPGTYLLSVLQSGSQTPLQTIAQVPIAIGNAYTIVLGGLMPGVAAANPPNPVHGFTPVLLTDQSQVRSAPLTTGCNQVVFSVPVGTAIQSLLSRVTNPDAVASIWRFDNAYKVMRAGYFGDPTAPVEYTTTVASPEAAFICVSAPTTWIPT